MRATGSVPDAGSSGIRSEEWLVELEKLSKRDDGGLTTRELCDESGLSDKTIKEYIRRAIKLGWVIVGRKTVTAINGNRATVGCYTIRRPAVAAKARKKGR